MRSASSSFGLENSVGGRPVVQLCARDTSQRVAWVAGQLPKVGDDVLVTGKVGAGVSLEVARGEARILHAAGPRVSPPGAWNARPVERVLKVVGFVASAPGFNAQPKVIDAASDLLVEVFGDAGRHARSALVSPSCRGTQASRSRWSSPTRREPTTRRTSMIQWTRWHSRHRRKGAAARSCDGACQRPLRSWTFSVLSVHAL